MNSEHILIVEDDHSTAASLREWLEMAGYRVTVAANGRLALKLLEQFQPDIILSDISMPEMDGYEFLEVMRAQSQLTTVPFIFLTGRNQRQDVLVGRGLGADDYITKPWQPDDLLIAIRGKLKRAQDVALAQLHRVYKESLTVLANAIEARDAYTRGHVERVCAYAAVIARELGCTEQELSDLEFGAILHDIGKIAVPETILSKPDRLTEEERREIRKHPEMGVSMVRDISYMALAIPCIQHHHERYDGDGYPNGLTGESIPLTARVLAVADTFDAIISDRPYRPARTPAEATTEIVQEAGRQFDPRVVDAFQRAVSKGLIVPVL
jgi:putative two-component system response regulator